MANKRITELVDIGTPLPDDVLEIVKVSDTTDSPEGSSYKVKVSELGGGGGATPTLDEVTTAGNISTNDIEMTSNVGTKYNFYSDSFTIKGNEDEDLSGIFLGSTPFGIFDGTTLNQYLFLQGNSFKIADGNDCKIESTTDSGIQVNDPITKKGLTGIEDFSANYDDLTYVQKKWVDDNFEPIGGGGGGATWGGITGTLSAQTDLQTALDTKQNLLHRVSFLDFVTNPTDLSNILTNVTVQNYANMTTYFDNAVTYCKANGIKSMFFPSGTYRFNQVTIDNLDNFYFVGEGAIIKDTNLALTTAILKFTNCNNVTIKGFSFIGSYGSYADFDFIDINTNSSYFNIYDNIFANGRRSFINISNLSGGASSEGCNIFANFFRAMNDYSNDNQACIILGEDGEYCKITNNFFKSSPSALRAMNGANGVFAYNTILGMTTQGFDATYSRGIVYLDDTGSNNGKFDIIENKINHNGFGATAIVYKGVKTSPQNAGKIIGNDILVQGSATNSTSIYLKNNPKVILKDNKIRGNSTITSSGIILEDSDSCYLDGNNISNYINGIELINSLTVKIGYNLYDTVTNNVVLTGTSSIIPELVLPLSLFKTTTATVTGTTSTSKIDSLLVPANTLKNGKRYNIIVNSEKNNAGLNEYYIFTNTVDSITGATQFARVLSGSANRTISLERLSWIDSGNLVTFPSETTNQITNRGVIFNGTGRATIPITLTSDLYIILACMNADTTTISTGITISLKEE